MISSVPIIMNVRLKRYPVLLFFLLLILNSCNAPNSEKELRIITYNIWNGFTEVPEQKRLWIGWLNEMKPDVVALQELNKYSEHKLKEDAIQWGHKYTALLKLDGFPTGITSRFPIEDIQRTLEGFHHGLLRVRIQGIYFYVIHLHPSNFKMRMKEADLILEDVKTLPENSNVVLAGDFNALSIADSIYYIGGNLGEFFYERDQTKEENNLNKGSLDYEVINKILKHGFIDTEVAGRLNDYQFTGSFPTALKKPGEHGDNRRLDYVFVSPSLNQYISSSKIIYSDITIKLSDHLPVLVEIQR